MISKLLTLLLASAQASVNHYKDLPVSQSRFKSKTFNHKIRDFDIAEQYRCENIVKSKYFLCTSGCNESEDYPVCMSECNRHYVEELDQCPCNAGCPNGCPQGVHFFIFVGQILESATVWWKGPTKGSDHENHSLLMNPY